MDRANHPVDVQSLYTAKLYYASLRPRGTNVSEVHPMEWDARAIDSATAAVITGTFVIVPDDFSTLLHSFENVREADGALGRVTLWTLVPVFDRDLFPNLRVLGSVSISISPLLGAESFVRYQDMRLIS